MQRSDGLLRLMLKKQVLTDEELELIWTNCQRHDSTALDLTTVLQGISYSIEAKELAFFTAKILAKSPTLIKGKEVELMLSMGRRQVNNNPALRENQGRVIQFLWNYLFDEEAHTYLDPGLATTALNAVGELLRNTSAEYVLAYFARIIDNIKTHKQGYFSVSIADNFVRLFNDKDDMKKSVLLNSFQQEHNMLDLLILELDNYMGRVRE